jgi:hypothetical protein
LALNYQWLEEKRITAYVKHNLEKTQALTSSHREDLHVIYGAFRGSVWVRFPVAFKQE